MLKTSYNCEGADERAQRDYHGVCTSPHTIQPRHKSISRGITTISVSKKTQMSAGVREFRKPIFSPTGHLMSSDSIRQMVPVVNMEPSSGTKRTENSTQRNPNRTGNQLHLQKRQSDTPPIADNGQDQQTQYNNIMSIMREQLNRNIITLQRKSEQQNRRNQQLIIVLQKRLKQSQTSLKQKTIELSRLKQYFDSLSKKNNKQQIITPELNSNIQYLSAKLHDIEYKTKLLLQQKVASKLEQSKVTSVIKKVEERIEFLANQFMKMELAKFNNLSTRVTKFIQSRDKLLQNLQSSIEAINREKLIITTNQQNESKLFELKQTQQSIIKSLEKYSSKQFKYDSFQVDSLKALLVRLTETVNKLENQIFKFPKQSIKTISPQKKITSIQTINPTFKQFEIQQRQFLMNSKLSFTGQTCSFEDYQPPINQTQQDQRDQFFYPEQNQSYQRFTQQQSLIQQQSSEAVVQLAETIRMRKMKMPVKCCVNQGYLRIIDAGAYILDLKGSLMEFSNQDLETAVGRKIITL